MIRAGEKWRWGSLALLGGLWAVVAAGPATAETLVFHNACERAVVVQVSGVSRGVFRRDRPYLLQPGEATHPGVVLPGEKMLSVYDAAVPNRLLYQGALPCASCDRHFLILSDVPPSVRVQPRGP